MLRLRPPTWQVASHTEGRRKEGKKEGNVAMRDTGKERSVAEVILHLTVLEFETGFISHYTTLIIAIMLLSVQTAKNHRVRTRMIFFISTARVVYLTPRDKFRPPHAKVGLERPRKHALGRCAS